MDVWVNGTKVETTVEKKIFFLILNFFKGEFIEEGGTKTHFEIANGSSSYILSQSSGKRQIGSIIFKNKKKFFL
jgi:hypothetical protein